MNNEVSYTTMLGVTLVLLAVVIGLTLGIFGIVKSTATTGKVAVEDSLSDLDIKLLKPLGDKVVNGTTVNSTIDQFTGKPLAVLVSTKVFNDDKNSAKRDVYGYPIFVKGNHKVQNEKGEQKDVVFINYNALLQSAYKSHPDNTKGVDSKGLELKSGIYHNKSGFQNSRTENLLLDLNFSQTSTLGSSEYIRPDGKFKANLILDEGGKIIGIAFREF